MNKPSNDAGFTLLETLVAFAILSVSLGFLFQSFVGSSRGISKISERTVMVSLAETALARVGMDVPLRPGTYARDFDLDGFTYKVKISRPTTDEEASPRPGDMIALDVVVTVVSEQSEQTTKLTSRQLSFVEAKP